MPTYEYRCKSCGRTEEVFQSITDRPLKKCPACGKPALERLIGAGAGIIFKGSGFYETDYRSSSYKEGARKENGSSSTSSSNGSSASSTDKSTEKSTGKSDEKSTGKTGKKDSKIKAAG